MRIEEFYRKAAVDQDCRSVLLQSDWFASNVRLDPLSGEAMPELLTDFLRKVADYVPSLPYKDRVTVIIDGCEESIRHLMSQLNEEPRRLITDMPYWKARELDTSSFISLSRRPGRTIREKLASKPNIKAVKHYLSVDTTENRLLKALIIRLVELLELRHNISGKTDFELLKNQMYRWLGTDEALEIGRWENRPPNNTLLGHRDYRRIWRAWQSLQTLEDNLDQDILAIPQRQVIVEKWTKIAKMYADGMHIFLEVPVLPDFAQFDVKLLTRSGWKSDLQPMMFNEVRRTFKEPHFAKQQAVCVDPGYFQPRYAIGNEIGTLSSLFVEQFWAGYAENCDVSSFVLSRSDCMDLTDDIVTITYPDLLYADTAENEALRNAAAHTFARQLLEIFGTEELVWLYPDIRDDFSLELVRKSFNARFAHAVPLPRSVATVFQCVPYSSVKADGYKVAIYEPVGAKLYRTLLIARYSKDLQEAIPETMGFRWEKQVTVETNKTSPELEDDCGFWVVDNGKLGRSINNYGAICKDSGIVEIHDEKSDKAFLLRDSPVAGGYALHQLQKRAPDEPLWQNAIPELMIKAIRGGVLSSIYLVSSKTAVYPIPGRSVNLPIKEHFTLPSGRDCYRFRLYKGSKSEAIGYQMKLESKQLPYSMDVECELIMSYTYGADNPFRLEFRPIKETYKPIVAKWIPLEEVTDAVAPIYPMPQTWDDLKHSFNPKKRKYSDIPEWLLASTKTICSALDGRPAVGFRLSPWLSNDKGRQFAFLDDKVYVPRDRISSSLQHSSNFEACTEYHYYLINTPRGAQAWWLSRSDAELEETRDNWLHSTIRSSLMFPYCKFWSCRFSDSNSSDCRVVSYINGLQPYFEKLYQELCARKDGDVVKNDICVLLCIARNDVASVEIRSEIERLVWSRTLNSDAVGFYLGTLRGDELRSALSKLFKSLDSYALDAIATASWRNSEFITCFSAGQIERTAKCLLGRIKVLVDGFKFDSGNGFRRRTLSIQLELLLALLRTRDSEDDKTRSLLQPVSSIVKEFSLIIEDLVIYLLDHDIDLKFRVDIEVKKEEGDPTQDFLYALRCYLDGDDNSQAIRVTGITENF